MALFEFTFSDQAQPSEPLEADYSGWEGAKRVAARTLGVMASQVDSCDGVYPIGVDIRRDSEAEVVKLTLSIASAKRLDPKESGA